MRSAAIKGNWTEATLGELATWSSGKNLSANKRDGAGAHPILGANGIIGRTNEVLLDCDLITVGRVGACGETHRSAGPVWVSDNALIAIPNSRVVIDYLYHVLSVFDYKTITSGTTQPLITQNKLKNQVVQLPPLAEQKRIVDVIGAVDAYIAGLQQQADDARAARNAVLHELLTAGGDDWAETTIGATSHFVSARLSPADLDSDTPYIGLEHLNPFSAVITRSGFATNVVASVTPFEGEDVLFGRLRPYLHKVAFATFSGVCSPEILVLRALPSCAPKFLHALCSADATVKACVEMSAGTRMPRTNAGDLASINVALPPLSEQKRIVEIVAAMDAIISTTEQTVRDTQQLRSSLLSGLLSGAHEIPAAYDRLLGAA